MPLPGNLLFQDPSTTAGMQGMDPLSLISMLVAQGIRPAGMNPGTGVAGATTGKAAAGLSGAGAENEGSDINSTLRALGAVQAAAPPPVSTIMPTAAPRPDASSGLRGSQLAQMMAMLMGGAGAGRGGPAQPGMPTLAQLIAGR